MGIKLFRRTYKMRTSRGLMLPPYWCAYYGNRIDRVLVTGERFLIVSPEDLAEEAMNIANEIEKRTTIEGR
jgi:hypothetical protein